MKTTGVGSLPHVDPEDAARFVTATVEIPYLPQLPLRHPEEAMLAQWGDGLCGAGAGGLGLEWGVGVGAREQAFLGAEVIVAALPVDTPVLKTQAAGPVTLAAAIAAAGHPGNDVLGCVVEGLTTRICAHVDWLRRRFPAAGITVVLDEPALGAATPGWGGVESTEAFDAISEVLDAVPVPAGIHCCGDSDWEAVARLRPSVLSLDLATLGPRFVDGAGELAAAVSEGTRMIWGAVPVEGPPLPGTDAVVTRIRRAEGTLVLAGADIRRLDEAWISPACGMAGVTVDQAAAIAARVADVASVLRSPGPEGA